MPLPSIRPAELAAATTPIVPTLPDVAPGDVLLRSLDGRVEWATATDNGWTLLGHIPNAEDGLWIIDGLDDSQPFDTTSSRTVTVASTSASTAWMFANYGDLPSGDDEELDILDRIDDTLDSYDTSTPDIHAERPYSWL